MDNVRLPLEKAVFVPIEHNHIIFGDITFIQPRGFRFGLKSIVISVVYFVGDKGDRCDGLRGFLYRYLCIPIREVVACRWKR